MQENDPKLSKYIFYINIHRYIFTLAKEQVQIANT